MMNFVNIQKRHLLEVAKNKKIIIKLSLGLVWSIFLVTLYILFSPVEKDDQIVETNQSFEAFWFEYIKQNTPEVAYQTFKQSYEKVLPTEQHLVAHLFGGALFRAVGISGLSVCDMHYSSGCFHEFLGRALLEHGESILAEVDRYCKESNFDCQHGIGHGLLAYQGYEYKDLLKALDMCKSIGTVDVRDGCYGGIFMEYNMHTMIGPDVSVRVQDKNLPLDDLCIQIPDYASHACYFWIAQWFLASQNGSVFEKFNHVAKQCQVIKNEIDRLNCYSGMANDIPTFTDDIVAMGNLCDISELAEFDPLYPIQCRSAVASSLFMNIETRPIALQLCSKLTDEAHDFCKANAVEGDGRRIVPYTQWTGFMN